MNRKAWKVIDEVRNLKMSIVGTGKGETIKITGAAAEFPGRLLILQKALEELDRDDGYAISDGAKLSAKERENERLRTAMEQVFRWMREADIDITEPYGLVEECLGIPESKRAKSFTPKPSYAKTKKTKAPSKTNNARRDPQDAAPKSPDRPLAKNQIGKSDPEPLREPAPPSPSSNLT